MSQRIKITTELDKAKAKALRKALRDLPPQFRGRRIIGAQKKVMKPAHDEVYAIANRKLNSTSIQRSSFQVVQGKYAKKISPYVVLQAKDKQRLAKRYYGKYSMTHTTNFFKIDHIVTMGTDRGLRKAGRRTRAAQAGRDRIKILTPQGTRAYTTLSATKGKYYLVIGENGNLHPIKKIKHPGTEPLYYYDEALARTKRAMRNNFYAYVASEIVDYKRKKGIA